jgi:RNase P/RNase MRP subunit p30
MSSMMQLGWSVVAWNSSVFGKLSPATTKPHVPVVLDSTRAADATQSTIELRQYTRVTVSVDELVEAQALHVNNETLRQFDIVAAAPGNQRVLAYLCQQADIDIISIDFAHHSFSLNKKMLDAAVARGITFEICYSPLLTASRPQVIANSKVLLQYLRGRHVIISSAAETMSAVRGTLDVINILRIMQVSQERAAAAINKNCIAVLRHAAARRTKYTGAEVLSRADLIQRYPELGMPISDVVDTAIEEVESAEESEVEAGSDNAPSSSGETGAQDDFIALEVSCESRDQNRAKTVEGDRGKYKREQNPKVQGFTDTKADSADTPKVGTMIGKKRKEKTPFRLYSFKVNKK